MTTLKKGGRVFLRVTEEVGEFVAALAAASSMTESAVASMVFNAAIEAARRHGSPLPFPLKFEVSEQRTAPAPRLRR